jgi:hypothetical protein
MFATADWDDPYWTNKQHNARELARRGWRVIYVESIGIRRVRVSSKTDWRRILRRLVKGFVGLAKGGIQCEAKVFIVSPLLIPFFESSKFIQSVNRALFRIAVVNTTVRKKFLNPIVWTYHPHVLGLVNKLNISKIIYHCVDELSAVPGVNRARFEECEARLLSMSDVVFATSPKLARKCSEQNSNTHYLSNVVDEVHFGNAMNSGPIPREVEQIPEPRLVFHGVLSEYKLDFGLIQKMAEARPRWSWIFIGDSRGVEADLFLSELRKLPNIYLLGYREYSQIPLYLRGMNVGLLPNLLNDYTQSMFPMKFYEYVAAGLPIVGTGLNFTLKSGDHYIRASSVEDFLQGVEIQLSRGRLSRQETQSIIASNTWRARMERMLEIANLN